MLNIEILNDLNNWNYSLKVNWNRQQVAVCHWFYHWIIDSFEQLIHSGMKQVTVFMNW